MLFRSIGLGNFDEIFAVFRNASLNGTRTIHPESDWLWLWAEMGWLAIPLTLWCEITTGTPNSRPTRKVSSSESITCSASLRMWVQ